MLVVDLRNTRINVYNYSVVGNKNSDTIYFYYPKKYQNHNVYVKVLGENIADKFRIYEPNIEVKDDCIRAKWIMSQSVTVNKEIQVQLEYDITLIGGSEIAQSKIVTLKLQNTLDINGEVEPVYPSVLQELREDLDAEILNREQGDTALHNEIVAEKERAESVESGLRTDLDNHTADKNNPHAVTKAQVGLGNVDNTSDQNKPVSTAQQQALDQKVDKVEGKGLSTNDYTTEEKNKLAGVEAGAQANVLEGVKVNGTELPIDEHKKVNIDISGKVDKTTEHNKVYGTDNSGTQTVMPVDNGSGYGGNVARRDSNSQVHLPLTPTANDHATSKKYVDDLVATIHRDAYRPVDITEYPTLNDFLASTGEEGYLYLYPVDTSEAPTFESGFYRYIWEDNAWVDLGTTKIDLSNYYTKTETDTLLSNKQDNAYLSVVDGKLCITYEA